MIPIYFVGKYGETSHDDTATNRVGGYPVFCTFDESNPQEKHYMARFRHYEDAEKWAEFRNYKNATSQNDAK